MAVLDGRWEGRLRCHVVRACQQVVDTRVYFVGRDREGALQVTSARAGHVVGFLEDDEPAVLSRWSDSLYLTPEEAKALQRQLYARLEPRKRMLGMECYLLRLGLAPSP